MQITKSPPSLAQDLELIAYGELHSWQTPPLLAGLYRIEDHFRLAQQEAEHQLLAACWIGETNEKGYTARLLASFDLATLCTPAVRNVLTTWKLCPLQDQERRATWLWAILFANDLLLTSMKYATDYLPSEAPALLPRITDLHLGRLAVERLDPWLDDPLHLVQAGHTPILTANSTLAAGATVNDTVGIKVDRQTNLDWLIGELLAARPEFIVLTDDLPDVRQVVQELTAAGLKAYLYSEKNA